MDGISYSNDDSYKSSQFLGIIASSVRKPKAALIKYTLSFFAVYICFLKREVENSGCILLANSLKESEFLLTSLYLLQNQHVYYHLNVNEFRLILPE